MKLKILFLFLILITNIIAQVREIKSRSHFQQNDFEINFSLNLGVGFTSYESSNPNEGSYYYYNDGERPFIFLISAAVGYCVIDGLSVEPEFDINLITDSEISTTILLNAIYHFNIPKKLIYPFVKLGYGISNYIPDYYYHSPNDNSLSTGVINVGAGLKIVYSSSMALKLDINYKRYNSTNSNNDYYYYETTYEYKTLVETLTFSLGYSILF